MATSTAKDRLLLFVAASGLGQNAFEDKVGCSRGLLTHVKGVSPKLLDKIAKTFPDLNTIWLLTGEGHMLKSESPAYSYTNAPGHHNIVNSTHARIDHTEESDRIKKLEDEVQVLSHKLHEKELEVAKLQGMIEILTQKN